MISHEGDNIKQPNPGGYSAQTLNHKHWVFVVDVAWMFTRWDQEQLLVIR